MSTNTQNITKRDYNEWLEFCKQLQASTAVSFSIMKKPREQELKSFSRLSILR